MPHTKDHPAKNFDQEMVDVVDFNELIGAYVPTFPARLDSVTMYGRVRFIEEELKELSDAMVACDFAGQVDALIDIVYVVKGTAALMGLPWEDLWDEVQRSNMLKTPGKTKRLKVDAIKPEGWSPPDITGVLKKHGYKGG